MKYLPIAFRRGHPKYQDLGLPRIGREQKNLQIDLFLKHVYSDYLDGKFIILSLVWVTVTAIGHDEVRFGVGGGGLWHNGREALGWSAG